MLQIYGSDHERRMAQDRWEALFVLNDRRAHKRMSQTGVLTWEDNCLGFGKKKKKKKFKENLEWEPYKT